MKHFLMAASALMLSAGLPATAQSFNESQQVTAITVSQLQAMVTSLGHTIRSVDGTTVHAEGSGLRYSVRGTACDDAGACNGVNMAVTYNRDADDTAEDINRANVRYAAVSLWYDEDSIGISRYLVLDGGMTLGNVKFNTQLLLNIAPAAINVVNEQ